MAACAILYQKGERGERHRQKQRRRRHHVAAYFKNPTKRKRERPPPSSVFSFAGAEERRQSVRPSAERERKQYTTPPHRPSENSQRRREREREGGRLTFSPVILPFPRCDRDAAASSFLGQPKSSEGRRETAALVGHSRSRSVGGFQTTRNARSRSEEASAPKSIIHVPLLLLLLLLHSLPLPPPQTTRAPRSVPLSILCSRSHYSPGPCLSPKAAARRLFGLPSSSSIPSPSPIIICS